MIFLFTGQPLCLPKHSSCLLFTKKSCLLLIYLQPGGIKIWKKLLISIAGRSLTLSGKNKVCEINQSCFCMDKNTLIWLLSCSLFDLWDIYTSNMSTLQQPLSLVGAGSSENRLDTWREKTRHNCSEQFIHPPAGGLYCKIAYQRWEQRGLSAAHWRTLQVNSIKMFN